VGDLNNYELIEQQNSPAMFVHERTKEFKMRGSTFWLATGVLVFLAWGVSYFVFHVAGILIHLLLVLALISFMIYVFIGKRGVE
jgi:Family of unknown function (DUF5670)